MELTQEQKEIIGTNVEDKEILKINAFAGTGKTTTLVEYAKEHRDKRFLYVAFNKSVQLEAAKKFPKNVECRTSHSLAWKVGGDYKDKLVKNIKPYLVNKVLNLNDMCLSRYVQDTLLGYLSSASEEITKDHIPTIAERQIKQHAFNTISAKYGIPTSESEEKEQIKERDKIINESQEKVVSGAKELWKMMCKKEDNTVGMIHDGYLKLYQLTRPVLRHDCILFDEAQDSNPVTLDFVLKQRAGKVLVGDTHQSIYSFRGSEDALESIKATNQKYLRMSFRFGKNIADVANLLLQTYKREKQTIIGLGKGGRLSPVSGQHASISRTNAQVFNRAVENIGKRIFFVGGIEGYCLGQIMDAYNLYSENRGAINDPYIKHFKTFMEMKNYATIVEDAEIMNRCLVVEKYTHSVPNLIGKIEASTIDTMKNSDIILSTVHKSKGLEFEKVSLTNDYTKLLNDKGEIDSDVDREEVNMLYVAITRSKDILSINNTLSDFFAIKKWVPEVSGQTTEQMSFI